MKRTYSEKLRDPRWQQFREAFMEWREATYEQSPRECDECGEDTRGKLHVHHNVYHHGCEPWEYEFHEMSLYCEECHGRIHEVEEGFRCFIRAVKPHECYEFLDVLHALQEAEHNGLLKIALARAKNAIRDVSHTTRKPPGYF